MKRADLVKYLRTKKCLLLREGKGHSVFHNTENNWISTIPRHTEISNFLADKICKDLGLEKPLKK